MVKIKEKPIDVSNTTLSYKDRRHRKFDANQAKRHNFGKAHCMICDEVFTKYSHNVLVCSKECKRERKKATNRKWRQDNLEKVRAINCKDSRKYYEKNREKIKVRRRKAYAKKKQEE